MNTQTAFRLMSMIALVVCVLSVFGGCQTPGAVSGADDERVRFARAAVAADHELASLAGVEMLAMGGNAVDAAVAASFALSVVRPYSCGIGGGGFMVIHLPHDPVHGYVSTAINYRETSYVSGQYYEQGGIDSQRGGASVAVPGTVAGLLYALEHYGTLDRATVLGPAMRAAETGFVVDHHYEEMASRMLSRFDQHPGWKSAFGLVWERFLKAGTVRRGDRITNEPQRRVLGLIAEHGRDGFYGGEVAYAIIHAINTDPYSKGAMTLDQLRSYEPIEYRPMVGDVDGYRLLTMPPPSSGGVTMLQILRILEAKGYNFANHRLANDEPTHYLIEAIKHGFADRSRYLADPEFVTLPIDQMLSDENIQARASMIDNEVHPSEYYGNHGLIPEDGGTSHLSVVDPFGGAVACTETINLEFGSLVGVDGFGFVLNDEMDDFARAPGVSNAFGLIQSDRNLPAVGKRPLSSMSPTIVLDVDGRLFAVVGASGGPRIITSTLQVLLNAIAGRSAIESVALPRIHHQWLPDKLSIEDPLYVQFEKKHTGRGNEIRRHSEIGNVQLILRDPDGFGWQVACDPRKGGKPAGID